MTGYCWRSIYIYMCVCISDSFHTNHTRYSCLMIKQYMVGALRSFILLLIRFKWMQTLHGANNIKIFNKQCEHAWFMCLCLFYFFIIFASYGRLGVSISLTLHQDLKYYSLLFFFSCSYDYQLFLLIEQHQIRCSSDDGGHGNGSNSHTCKMSIVRLTTSEWYVAI